MKGEDETGTASRFCHLADYDGPQLQTPLLDATVDGVKRRLVSMLVSGTRTRTLPSVDLCLHGRVITSSVDERSEDFQASLAAGFRLTRWGAFAPQVGRRFSRSEL